MSEIEALVPHFGIDPAAAMPPPSAPPCRRPGFGHHVNMEGFMFPATYPVRPQEPAATLVSQQLEAFRAPSPR